MDIPIENQLPILEKEGSIIHLTGLKSRKFISDHIQQLVESLSDAKRRHHLGNHVGALLYISIDHFERIDDTCDYIVDVSILQNIAHILKNSVRQGDIVARWDENRILIFLSRVSEEEAIQKAKILQKEIENGTSHDTPVTVCIGVSGYQVKYSEGDSYSNWIYRVQSARSWAREEGLNSIRLFDQHILL